MPAAQQRVDVFPPQLDALLCLQGEHQHLLGLFEAGVDEPFVAGILVEKVGVVLVSIIPHVIVIEWIWASL